MVYSDGYMKRSREDYMRMNKEYNDESIRSLKGAERVRQRPGVMFGSDDMLGAFHTVNEIVSNSIDEVRAGYGKKVEVILYADDSISVRDYGRGVPMDWNKLEQRYNWDLIYNELYAGGKYDPHNPNYKFSLGLNGLGSAATQYTSEWFKVISYRSDFIFEKDFEKGAPTFQDLKKSKNTTGATGTFTHWKIDNEVFPETHFPFEMFKTYCESQAHLNEVDFVLTNEKTGEVLEIKGESIEHYLVSTLENRNKKKGTDHETSEGEDDDNDTVDSDEDEVYDVVIDTILKKACTRGKERGKDYVAECDVVLAITNETKSIQMHFHNTAKMTIGVHATAYEEAVTTFFRDVARKNKVKIKPYDYNDYLSVIVSSYSNSDITSYANQTKNGVSNKFIHEIVYQTVLDALEEAVIKGADAMTTLINSVVNAAVAREKAKELENQVRQAKQTTKRRAKAEKYVDCKSKKPAERELYILEGDSALGACKLARDGSFQALLPVKGKILNCIKASMDKILSNAEIKDIINTVGTGVEIGGSGYDLFNMKKLQFDKIIICTDADVDGFQIRVLIFAVFYKLMPRLLKENKVFVAETPLYEIITSKKTYFAYSVEEKDKVISKLGAKEKLTRINRSKGLGENDPDMLWETTMNPETRRLVPLTSDVNNPLIRRYVDLIFGEDTGKERQDFIFSSLGVLSTIEDEVLEILTEAI